MVVNSFLKIPMRTVLPWLLLPFTLAGCWSYISPEAQSRFQGRTTHFTVTVYPVNVVRGNTLVHDAGLSQKVATLLREEKLADPKLTAMPAEIPVAWGANQAKMAQRSAKAFAEAVAKDSIRTDYALLVEMLCNPGETQVIGVHYFLADRNGQLADGGLSNSHWDEFKQVQPTDRQGGYEVLARMLLTNWKRR
jgi:hypothetical protein